MIALVTIILVALAFDFINGFHDSANSIATVVSTRVLSPRFAVLWAAFFNFVAFLIIPAHVASNVAKGVNNGSLTLVAGMLVGAIAWDLLTWWWALPTSSSHALLGGLAGAAIVKGSMAASARGLSGLPMLQAGFAALDYGVYRKTVLFILLAPLIGFTLGWLTMKTVQTLLGSQRPGKIDRWFRVGQLVSAGAYSLGHGGNDAQKTMGIIAMALVASGHLEKAAKGHDQHVPLWVVLACHAAMGIGTMSGGWRIVKTMGMKITKLAPVGGFCAETAGAVTLFTASALGVPVSTTHTITGAIVGVGTTRKFTAVRWGIAGRIVWAWIFTIPGAALISALSYLALRAFGVPDH
jgi:PiT family inorganic phosphate transporter